MYRFIFSMRNFWRGKLEIVKNYIHKSDLIFNHIQIRKKNILLNLQWFYKYVYTSL